MIRHRYEKSPYWVFMCASSRPFSKNSLWHWLHFNILWNYLLTGLVEENLRETYFTLWFRLRRHKSSLWKWIFPQCLHREGWSDNISKSLQLSLEATTFSATWWQRVVIDGTWKGHPPHHYQTLWYPLQHKSNQRWSDQCEMLGIIYIFGLGK